MFFKQLFLTCRYWGNALTELEIRQSMLSQRDHGMAKAGCMTVILKRHNLHLCQKTQHIIQWNAADMRHHSGNIYRYAWSLYCGYHFHNLFSNVETLRKKYKTYGHAVTDAMEKNLGDIHEDLQAMIQCGLNKTKEAGAKDGLVDGGLDFFGSPFVPLAFKVPGYVNMGGVGS